MLFLEVSSALIHWAWNQNAAEGHGVISVLVPWKQILIYPTYSGSA